MVQAAIKYVSDGKGTLLAVLIPIELQREIESEKATVHLLKSKKMKPRLFEVKSRKSGISFKDAREKLGI